MSEDYRELGSALEEAAKGVRRYGVILSRLLGETEDERRASVRVLSGLLRLRFGSLSRSTWIGGVGFEALREASEPGLLLRSLNEAGVAFYRRLEGGRVEAVYFSASRTIHFLGEMEPGSLRRFVLRRIRRGRSA